jgi:probable rRNA maturation factor
MIAVQLFVQSRYLVDRKKLRQAVERVLHENGVDSAQVDISIVGARKMKLLNESKLQHEGSTDVLSFPQHERHQHHDFPLPDGVPPHLGDIVVCYPEAISHARRYGKLVDDQICFFIEHGLMHLLGYHHEE